MQQPFILNGSLSSRMASFSEIPSKTGPQQEVFAVIINLSELLSWEEMEPVFLWRVADVPVSLNHRRCLPGVTMLLEDAYHLQLFKGLLYPPALTSGHLSWIQVGCQGSLGHIGVLEPEQQVCRSNVPNYQDLQLRSSLAPRSSSAFTSVGPGLPGEELTAPLVDPVPSRQTILNLRKNRNDAKNNLLGTKS